MSHTRKYRTGSRQKRRRARNRKPNNNAPRTTDQYLAKPERFQGLWNRITKVISKMRGEKTSLQKAAREVGISPRTVVRWSGKTLTKNSSGRYAVKGNDRLLRVLVVPGSDGPREIGVRGSRTASELGKYWSAVHKYLSTGDTSRLEKFQGKKIKDANGNEILLLTELRELNSLASAGVLSFESIYRRAA